MQGTGLGDPRRRYSPRLSAGDSIDIPVGTDHRMANPTDADVVFVEVQHGEYFGEDDIVRLEDDYGRSRPVIGPGRSGRPTGLRSAAVAVGRRRRRDPGDGGCGRHGAEPSPVLAGGPGADRAPRGAADHDHRADRPPRPRAADHHDHRAADHHVDPSGSGPPPRPRRATTTTTDTAGRDRHSSKTPWGLIVLIVVLVLAIVLVVLLLAGPEAARPSRPSGAGRWYRP